MSKPNASLPDVFTAINSTDILSRVLKQQQGKKITILMSIELQGDVT